VRGVVLDGPNVGCARRLEPGDVLLGHAVYVEADGGLALVRLARPMPSRSSAGGIY
jgi:hypothetical protein